MNSMDTNQVAWMFKLSQKNICLSEAYCYFNGKILLTYWQLINFIYYGYKINMHLCLYKIADKFYDDGKLFFKRLLYEHIKDSVPKTLIK